MKCGETGIEKIRVGDIWTFIHDTDGRVFRYWVYRRMFTPLETSAKYIDESVYEDVHCKLGTIHDCVILPDNDVLIGFKDVEYDCVDYYKLSEIRMSYYPVDSDEEGEEDEEGCAV